jgi:hypothetical protein
MYSQPNNRGAHAILLVIANVVPTSQILDNLIMEALSSSETLFLKTATRRHIS